MKKVEEKDKKMYIDGREVVFVKAEPVPKPPTPGQVWAGDDDCPICNTDAWGEMPCESCKPMISKAYDAGRAARPKLPTVEEWWAKNPRDRERAGGNCFGRVDCNATECHNCTPICLGSVESFRKYAMKKMAESPGGDKDESQG